jgi:multidrug efflux pump subunit AcrB
VESVCRWFENGFNGFRERYRRALAKLIAQRTLALICVSVVLIAFGNEL